MCIHTVSSRYGLDDSRPRICHLALLYVLWCLWLIPFCSTSSKISRTKCTWVLVTISLALSWHRTHPGCSSTRFLKYVNFRACDSKSHRCHRLGTPDNDKNSCSADSLALVKMNNMARTTNTYHTEDLILKLFAVSLGSMPTNISLFGAGY